MNSKIVSQILLNSLPLTKEKGTLCTRGFYGIQVPDFKNHNMICIYTNEFYKVQEQKYKSQENSLLYFKDHIKINKGMVYAIADSNDTENFKIYIVRHVD